jgi:hypothetical protein
MVQDQCEMSKMVCIMYAYTKIGLFPSRFEPVRTRSNGFIYFCSIMNYELDLGFGPVHNEPPN